MANDDISQLPVHEQAQLGAFDDSDAAEARQALSDWGDEHEYRPNIRLINQHLDDLPEERRAHYENGRHPDGRRFLNDAGILRDLAREARAAPASLTEAAKTNGITEREQIKRWVGDYSSPYWKGKDAARIQAFERDLIRADVPKGSEPAASESMTTKSAAPAANTLGAEYQPMFDSFTGAMGEAPAASVSAAVSWFGEVQKGPPELEMRRDNFNVPERFAQPDIPYVNHFLNVMHDAGASQRDVDAAIGWYRETLVPAVRQAQQQQWKIK